jgi:signal transduction histidine kinase
LDPVALRHLFISILDNRESHGCGGRVRIARPCQLLAGRAAVRAHAAHRVLSNLAERGGRRSNGLFDGVFGPSGAAAMAPWAIAQDKAIAFAGTEWPVNVKANVHALEDALRNLIENAVAHAPARTEVTVTVDRAARIDVADRGSGVLPKDRENIFKRFWRGAGEKKEGAGLGLAIVNEIMRAHRGSVSVADNPGGGALFSLSFPPVQATDSKIAGRCIAADGGRAETATRT